MISTKDIAWLAGLLEGEGCFRCTGSTPSVYLQMTDRDVVERAAVLLGAPSVRTYWPKPPRKPTFLTAIHGQRAAGWMMTLFALLGERRREKVCALLANWKTTSQTPEQKSLQCRRASFARWERMTPDQRHMQIAKMTAGRKEQARARRHDKFVAAPQAA